MSHVAQIAAATLFGVWLVAAITGVALGMKARRKAVIQPIDQHLADEIRRVLNGEESQ